MRAGVTPPWRPAIGTVGIPPSGGLEREALGLDKRGGQFAEGAE